TVKSRHGLQPPKRLLLLHVSPNLKYSSSVGRLANPQLRTYIPSVVERTLFVGGVKSGPNES
ncbi:MAG: hypothetical protein ACI9G1_005234, partial [Pirellulaceae bacterium]